LTDKAETEANKLLTKSLVVALQNWSQSIDFCRLCGGERCSFCCPTMSAMQGARFLYLAPYFLPETKERYVVDCFNAYASVDAGLRLHLYREQVNQ
jgi:hypothetical protein